MLGLAGLSQSQPEPRDGVTSDSSPTAEPSPEAEIPHRSASHEQAAELLRSIIESAVEHARDEMRAVHKSLDDAPESERRPGESRAPGPGEASPALLVAWLAVEIESLDVPPEHIERVRGELLGLARHLESGEIEWTMVQNVIQSVLPYPALARRLLPLITPRLEDAA
jgi:hypothetical protein